MIFFRICSIGIFLVFFTFSTPAASPALAQTAPKSTPNLSMEELQKLWENGRLPHWMQPQTEEPFPMPLVRRHAPHAHPPGPAKEPQFSEWGYRHKELHAKGVIAELMEKTRGKNCCNGIESGECRVTKVNLRERLAFVDDEWCPMDPDTRVTPLDSLADIIDGDEEIAVVCASKNYDHKKCGGIKTYCIGTKPPKV